ncbi:PREDICTED: uncharacterized protein LOC104612463 [Nelumbo nucifera]|uniref:ATP-dependent DNA helicase n=1 Tax=Nelumbo nucifera TaxID=4432 RepID=A0A1U8BMC5_NELNU|nr:PREDICTED: uncharacterized protein LOC104612463 [Nelumbo nucifera]
MLLYVIRGARSFYDLKTTNGTRYDIYKAACMALGLLEDDNEWNHALMEASIWATGQQMHDIFASILLFNEVANAHDLWRKHWTHLSQYKARQESGNMNFRFVHGSRVTGKTFLWRTLTSKLRSTGKIVLVIVHQHAFEAFDRTVKDLMKSSTLDASNKPFDGKTVVLGGDFRQILPVIILKGSREDVISASLQRSHLWSQYVGNGNITGVQIDEFGEANWVPFPPDLLVADEGRGVRPLVERIFPNIVEMIGNQSYLCERAILAPTNDEVDDINARIISLFPGDIQTYLSADTNSHLGDMPHNYQSLYPP